MLVHTSRRYTCEACANVTPDFREKWISSQEKTSDLPDKTLEVVKRIENSIVDTIISMHKINQDDKIQTLQQEIVNTSSISKRVEHLEKKIEYLTDTTIAKIDNIKDTMTSPDFKLLETKLNKVTSEIEKINHNLDKTCQTLDKTVTSESGIAESLSKIAAKLPVQLQHDSNVNVDKKVENQSNLNIQRNSHALKLGTRNMYGESSEFDIETSNRFSPLSEADESLNEQLQQNSDNKRAKILLIGNSHIDRIRTENVLSNCLVHKYVGYTFDEMFEKIEELDQDYDCILLHVFANNLRNGTPEQCAKICDEYISALSSHCKCAKIILSLPFLTMTEQELNNKIVESNILFQYKYLNKSNVSVCNNSVLSNGNVPIRKFYLRNGPHLTYQGTSVFVTNIKFHMKKVLHIEVTRPKQMGLGQVKDLMSTCSIRVNKHSQRIMAPPTQLGYNNSEVPAVPPFLMYPWGPSFNPSLYTNTTKNSWYPQFT